MAEIFGFLMFLPIFALGVGATAFWIWMLVECATKEPSEGNEKLIWVIIIVFAGFIGAAIYFFARRPKRMAGVGK